MPLSTERETYAWFITLNDPVREARFKRNPDGTNDGEVHDLFVITGRTDAPGCNIMQPNFQPAGSPFSSQNGNPNLTFRIPTPMFGVLASSRQIPDSAILANMKENLSAKSALGISGHGLQR